MRIDQLPVASAIGNTDTLPFSDGGITKQISVGNLTNSIRDNVYGAPLTASTSSAMTDTSRVYVYTGTTGGGFTNGHWYYYNGSAWTDGGTYNSAAVQTDATLTLEGVPADAKATGELKTVIDDKLAEFDVAVETFYPHDGYNGPMVTVEGTVDAPPAELVIYGMSLQEGATPSPSAPVDIVTAGEGGTLAMVSAGKNLIDSSGLDGYTKNGLTCAVDGGAVTISGNAPSAVTLLYASKQSLAAGTYIISGGVSSNISVDLRDDNGAQISGTASTGSDTTFTLTKTRNDIWPCIRVAANASVSGLVIRPMVRLASISDATFVPYNGITSAIPTPNGLPGIPVSSGGNYIDTGETRWICDTIDFKAGTWTKRCGVVTLNGSENWFASTQVAGRYYLASTYTPNAVPYANHLCTHAVANPGSPTSDTGKSFFASGANFDINTEYASVDAFKAALAANNMTLIYQLAAPVVDQLMEEQLTALRALRGRKGQTVMYSPDPVVPGFPVAPEFLAEMYIDIPTYIQSLLSQMDRGFNVAAVNNGLEFTSIE